HRLGAGRYVAGDHRENASINGALRSGRRAAEAILADLAA
ncbi:MAG: FAD-dependent oxidoreductase, partial [Actinomycetota bacterium]